MAKITKKTMKMLDKLSIHWLKEPENHNYPAAESYLRLIYDDIKAKAFVDDLKTTTMTKFKAKDIFRASGLSLLGISNSHVKKNLKKIENGKELSPILLVRDSVNGKVIIADGYHRLCATYRKDECEWVPCKIV